MSFRVVRWELVFKTILSHVQCFLWWSSWFTINSCFVQAIKVPPRFWSKREKGEMLRQYKGESANHLDQLRKLKRVESTIWHHGWPCYPIHHSLSKDLCWSVFPTGEQSKLGLDLHSHQPQVLCRWILLPHTDSLLFESHRYWSWPLIRTSALQWLLSLVVVAPSSSSPWPR